MRKSRLSKVALGKRVVAMAARRSGASQAAAAELVGVTPRSVRLWEAEVRAGVTRPEPLFHLVRDYYEEAVHQRARARVLSDLVKLALAEARLACEKLRERGPLPAPRDVWTVDQRAMTDFFGSDADRENIRRAAGNALKLIEGLRDRDATAT